MTHINEGEERDRGIFKNRRIKVSEKLHLH
jgi:hypothetical protein